MRSFTLSKHSVNVQRARILGRLQCAAMFLLACLLLIAPIMAQAEDRLQATLVIDAEFGHPTSTSAQAIELGARLAIRDMQRSGALSRVSLDLRRSDNRGIAAIGVDNFIEAAKDPSVVAVMGGKFSPVQVEVVKATQAQGLMLLAPWGSADGIIDNGLKPNWAFRLSLKDEWASEAFVAAARRAGASRAGVILPHTAWGRSMQAALGAKAQQGGLTLVGERWYNWGESSLIQRYLDLLDSGAETIILVANEIEGSIFVRELARLPEAQRKPILAHWGVTGGDFDELAGDALDKVDLRIIQTFSFHLPRTKKAEAFLEPVLAATAATSIAEVNSPIGIAHAYDLTWLLAMAIDAAGSVDRAKVRDAMERLGAFEGVTRYYEAPFTRDRHEALSPKDIFFARYLPGRGLAPSDR